MLVTIVSATDAEMQDDSVFSLTRLWAIDAVRTTWSLCVGLSDGEEQLMQSISAEVKSASRSQTVYFRSLTHSKRVQICCL